MCILPESKETVLKHKGIIMSHLFQTPLTGRAEWAVSLPRLLVRVGEVTEKAGDRFVFERFGLNAGRYALLSVLEHLPESPKITTLKGMVLRSAANLTQTLDFLEQRGLVRRASSATDRRVYLVEITEQGRKLLREVEAHFKHTMLDYVSEYSDDELKCLVEELQRFGQKTVIALEESERLGTAQLPANVKIKPRQSKTGSR